MVFHRNPLLIELVIIHSPVQSLEEKTYFKVYKYILSFKGSKKSGPIRLVKEASEQVESLNGIAINDSSLNSSATMESVCHELQTKSHLLQVRLYVKTDLVEYEID